MSVSPVDICNVALSRIGVKQRIAALTENSEAARLCNLNYETVLDATLSQDEWPFATRRAPLALIEADPDTEWAFRYALPEDCVCAQRIESGFGNRQTDLACAVKFRLEADTGNQRTTLLADKPEPILVYTTRSQPSSLYPAWFVNLLQWNLAVELAPALTARAEIMETAARSAFAALHRARAHARDEGQDDEPIDSEFVRARY
jgi:hypothetical protein